MTAKRVEHIGEGITLYLGDCRNVLPSLGCWEALLTDPPYGIGMDGGKVGKSEYKKFDWDGKTAEDGISLARNLTGFQIIFGGNYYNLPPSGHWLIWDKQNDPTTFADFEMAWTNLGKSSRMIRHLWSGPYMKVKEERFHPTQKPLAVMRWCIEQFPPLNDIIDPFMGSGTTGVAAVQMGKKFTGIEVEETYFDTACKRIEQATKQGDLFIRDKPAAWDDMWQRKFDYSAHSGGK